MGRWSHFSGVKVSHFQEAIEEALSEYGDIVYEAMEDGLSAAEKVLIKRLKSATPKKTGKFRKGWKGTGRKYKLLRFVGNSTTVEGESGDIALANIFEYSTTRGNPFIKTTFLKSVDEMVDAAVAEIKKEV